MKRSNNKIVIFDDDEDILSLCDYVLTEAGWQVFTFINCDDIVERVTGINPAVILMDNWIPDCGGVVATRLLKTAAGTKEIPVIYFTANSNVAKLAREAGADNYLAKPFDIADLESIIVISVETTHPNRS